MSLSDVNAPKMEEDVSQLQTRLTAEDLLKLPMGKGKRYELRHGVLIEMAPAEFRHGEDALRIGAIIHNFIAARRLGHAVGAETGFTLSRNPDHVRAPDCAFIAAGRVSPGPSPVGYLELAPDFVVEVILPGDTATEVEERVEDWLHSSTAIVWAANSARKTVMVWRGLGQAERRSGDDDLDAEPALPGFRCKVSELFAD
jgi:Uma2 family endonuclease